MPKKEFKYRLPIFISAVVVLELVFWVLVWQLLSIFGVFSDQGVGEQLSFLHPAYAWWFLTVPLLMAIFIYQLRQRNQLVEQLGSVKTLRTFMRYVSTRNVFIRYFLIRNTIVFAVFALMQPALGTKTIKGTTTGVELIFAVDISNSMNTRDIVGGETRLIVAKRAMNQLINESTASRIGLLVFAGNAYPQLPLTADKNAAKMYIDELNTSIISNQGTNISAALEESSRFFSKEETKKVLILITDGEDHEGGMKKAYAEIKKANVDVFILGIGTEKGGIVPESEEPRALSLKDDMGRSVISKVNLSMLEDIANEVGGEVLLSNESFPNVSDFLTQINTSSETNTVDLEFKVSENRYQWPLGLALLTLLVLLVWEAAPKREIK
ncbi:VWA domain-containing protein [Brumimicrobium sp.]|uniref:VWA domain-containing protein n=1 Tax=Brumimicrobium sp. TaxID=2029867 RepID=UPI003A91D35A